MSSREEHIELNRARGKFIVDCNHGIFSGEEIEILEKWGYWFQALTSGELEPITELQKSFVAVARQDQTPFSPEETAWNKYLNRKRIEEAPNNRLELDYRLDDEPFHNREMMKQQRKIMFNVISKTHRE